MLVRVYFEQIISYSTSPCKQEQTVNLEKYDLELNGALFGHDA